MACFAVFVADNHRSTIANEHELEAAARYPILASIPSMTFVARHRSIGETTSDLVASSE
jgi:hypothetical protein